MRQSQKLRAIPFSFFIATLALLTIFTFTKTSEAQTFPSTPTTPTTTPTPPAPQILPTTTPPQPTYAIDPTKVLAQSVLVKNLNTGQILFSRESQRRLPLASISKLMTAITVKTMQENWKTLPAIIRLSPNIGGALTAADRAVKAGGYMKTNDLNAYMLLTSSNYAAYSLTHELIPFSSFMAYMNFTAKNIGLKNSHFINGSGLTEIARNKTHSNSEGTAEDVMTMLQVFVKKYPELARATRTPDAFIRIHATGEKIPIENTNKLLDSMDNIFLGKTGYTGDAGGNLAIVIQKNDQYYGIVVLGSTAAARFDDVAYLASQI